MKILAVADEKYKYYYDYYVPGRLDDFDLILSCGDLAPEYLEFLVTMARCPLLYVHGNHDGIYDKREPEGCICVDDRVYVHQGVRIFGLGGSFRYRSGKYMYTEWEMKMRILKSRYAIWKQKGIDIFLTHAPARNINDLDDIAHRGFECFHYILDKYKPRYFIHGHIHRNYGLHIPREFMKGETIVMNAYEHIVFNI